MLLFVSSSLFVLNLNSFSFHRKKKEQVHIRPKFRKGRSKKTKSEMQNAIDTSLEDEIFYYYF